MSPKRELRKRDSTHYLDRLYLQWGVGQQNNDPCQRCPRPDPSTCDVFADVITWRIFRWSEFPGFPRWAQCNHKNPDKNPYTSKTGRQTRARVVGCEENKTGHCRLVDGRAGASSAGSFWKLEKARKQILPKEPPEGTQPCPGLSPLRCISGFWPPELKVTNTWCFKPLSLW